MLATSLPITNLPHTPPHLTHNTPHYATIRTERKQEAQPTHNYQTNPQQ